MSGLPAPAPSRPAAPARAPFREPTRGTGSTALYVVRYVLGIAVLVVAALVLIGAIWWPLRTLRLSEEMLPRPLVGYLLLAGGWFVLPGHPGRAAIAAGAAVLSTLLFLNTLPIRGGFGLLGNLRGDTFAPGYELMWIPQALAVSGLVAAWFVVRKRPGLVFTLLPVPFVAYSVARAVSGPATFIAGEQLFREAAYFRGGVVVAFLDRLFFAIERDWPFTLGAAIGILGVIVASAWLGRVLAPVLRGTDPAVRAQRIAAQQAAWIAHQQAQAQAAAAADAAWRVAEITRWEDAYAAAHNGERPPPGWSPPAPTAPPPGWQPPPGPTAGPPTG